MATLNKELLNALKDIVRQSISEAERKYLPHFYTDDKDVSIIYQQFTKSIKSYYSTILSLDKLKNVVPSESSSELFDFDEYFLSTNIKKTATINEILALKEQMNGNNDSAIILIMDNGIEFLRSITAEILESNKIIPEEEKKTVSHLPSPFSIDNGVLPLSSLKNIENFKRITGQKQILFVGQIDIDTINNWVHSFCIHAPMAMEAIGLNESAITLNKRIEYYYYHHQEENSTVKGTIEYDLGALTQEEKHYISFYPGKGNTQSTLLHEWAHGLDLEIGYKLNSKVSFASQYFMNGESINTKPEISNIVNKGNEFFALALNGTDFKTYESQKDIAISQFKTFMTEKIGQAIHSDWDSLTEETKTTLKEINEFQKLMNHTISYMRIEKDYSTQQIGKLIHKIIKSENFQEAFPQVKHTNTTAKARKLLAEVANYTIENNIAWFYNAHKTNNNNNKNKNDIKHSISLVNTDFAKISSIRGYLTKNEYMFLPHEIFARKIQVLSLEPLFYEKHVNQPEDKSTTEERAVLNKCSNYPEVSLLERTHIIDLIHNMCHEVDIKPNIKFHKLIEANKSKYIEVDNKIEKRGALINNSRFIKRVRNRYINQIKEADEKILITEKRQDLINSSSKIKIKIA